MTSASAREEARKAAHDALDDALPHEARQFTGASILSDTAIDAYEAALKAAGYVMVPREASEAMISAGISAYALLDSQDRSRMVVTEIHNAMTEAATNPAP